jgi:hypothetical protein
MYAWVFQDTLPSGFPTKTLCAHLLSPIHTTYPTHLTLLDLITWIIFGEEYRSLSTSLCSFLYSLLPLRPKYSQIPSAYVPPSMWVTTNCMELRYYINMCIDTYMVAFHEVWGIFHEVWDIFHEVWGIFQNCLKQMQLLMWFAFERKVPVFYTIKCLREIMFVWTHMR